MEEAKITFYNFDKCGLFEYGAEEPKFGSLSNYLDQLTAWVKRDSKSLEETCTYAIEESEDVSRTFCYDIVKNDITGDFLLTTWNETPSYKGKVAAVNSKDKVGEAKVEFTKLPKDSIPGYATYFWIIPSKNVFASIRFHHVLNGKKNFDKYFKEFISKFSDYVVLGETESVDFPIIGYAEYDDDEPINLHAYLKTSILRKSGQTDYIIDNVDKIRKVTRHNCLSPKYITSQEFWQKALVGLGLKKQKTLDSDVNFSYEFSFKPTAEELKEMINEWEANHDSKWDDIGFTLTGEQSPRWLSNSLARDTVELDIKRSNDEIVDANSILEQVTKKRNSILALLN